MKTKAKVQTRTGHDRRWFNRRVDAGLIPPDYHLMPDDDLAALLERIEAGKLSPTHPIGEAIADHRAPAASPGPTGGEGWAGVPDAEKRSRKLYAEMREAELKTAEREGALMSAEQVSLLVTGLLVEIRSEVLAIHHEVRSAHPKVSPAVLDTIRDRATRALRRIAAGDAAESICRSARSS